MVGNSVLINRCKCNFKKMLNARLLFAADRQFKCAFECELLLCVCMHTRRRKGSRSSLYVQYIIVFKYECVFNIAPNPSFISSPSYHQHGHAQLGCFFWLLLCAEDTRIRTRCPNGKRPLRLACDCPIGRPRSGTVELVSCYPARDRTRPLTVFSYIPVLSG